MKFKLLLVLVMFICFFTASVCVAPYVYSQEEDGEGEEEEEPIQARPNPLENVIRTGDKGALRGKTQMKDSDMLGAENDTLGEAAEGMMLKGDTQGEELQDKGTMATDEGSALGSKPTKMQELSDDGQHGDGKVMDDGEHGDEMSNKVLEGKAVSEKLGAYNKQAGKSAETIAPVDLNINAGSMEEEFGGSLNVGEVMP